MEKLERHISALIARHNCVIVPGIGAFLAHEVPASYSKEEHIFMPPQRVLDFNPSITIDDALLVSSYMNEGNISFEKAETKVRREVAALRSTLSRTGSARLGELGTFTMGIDGKISFKSAASSIDDPANYGFEPLAIPTLDECAKRNIVIPINRRYIGRYIATAAAAIALLMLIIPFVNNAQKDEMQASFAPTISIPKTANVATKNEVNNSAPCEIQPVEYTSTTADDIVSLIDEDVEPMQEVTPVESATENTAIIDEVNSSYHIIVASSPNEQNAQLAIEELSAKRAANYNVVKCGKRHRIAISSHNSESEAMAALVDVQTTFPDAWIYSEQ